MKKYLLILLISSLYSCIGTDLEDDPKNASILADRESAQLIIGNTVAIEATYYYNMWVPRVDEPLIWQSANEAIAVVSQTGVITAIARGQTQIMISSNDGVTKNIPVTVVESDNEVANVTVSANETSLTIGETLQFTAEAFTISNATVSNASFSWSSNDTGVATVDQNGLVTGVSDGSVGIIATADGVASEPFVIMVGTDARVGTFRGVGSYDAEGTAILSFNDSDQLILTFSDNFKTDFALGTFVYLANTTSGSSVRAQGLEIAEVVSNGAKTYNITSVNSNVDLNTYRFVILLCKPASITFGTAELR